MAFCRSPALLRGLKTKPKRAMINYYHDVLCTQN